MIFAVFALLIVIFVVLPLAGWALWLVISTAVVGIIFGALGRLIVPGPQPIGILATICCGWVGSIIGGLIGRGASLGRFATVLIEIGISAAAVAVWSGSHRRSIGNRNRGILPR